MLAVILIFLLCFYIAFFIPNERPVKEDKNDELRRNPQMKKLWSLAQTAMRERKPLKAEKALLTILKIDERNAAAYNRLGILYAREKHYKEAIECFEIAESLDNNASSLHNVGLIYLETGKYEKAALAFEQAINLEGDQPGRYIAYAKALEKLGQSKRAIEQLETAYTLNPTTVILRHMLEIYENNQDYANIEATKKRIEDLQEQRAKLEEQEKKTAEKKPARKTTIKKTTAKTDKTKTKAAKAEAKAHKAEEKAHAKAAKNAAKAEAKTAKTAQAKAKPKIAKKRKII